MLGMEHLEASPRTLLQGIQWASETITNTGYGADNRWNHPLMAMFVIITPFILKTSVEPQRHRGHRGKTSACRVSCTHPWGDWYRIGKPLIP
jgi:hypothetical protein